MSCLNYCNCSPICFPDSSLHPVLIMMWFIFQEYYFAHIGFSMLTLSRGAPFSKVHPLPQSLRCDYLKFSSRIFISYQAGCFFNFLHHILCFPHHFPQSSSGVNGLYLSLHLPMLWPIFKGYHRDNTLHGAFPMHSNLPRLLPLLNLLIVLGPHIWFEAKDALVIFYEALWSQLLAYTLRVDLCLTVTKHL